MTYCLESHNQFTPGVAFNGTKYCAVWMDTRELGAIFMTFIDTEGNVLNVNGIRVVSNATGARVAFQTVRIASSGTDFLVVWIDDRNNPGAFDIFGARIRGDGIPPNGSSFAICDQSGVQGQPEIAGNATAYLVVWEDQRNSSGTPADVYGALVPSSGPMGSTAGFPISNISDTAARGSNPQVATDGSNYLVAWYRYFENSVLATRVTAAGSVQDPLGVEVAPGAAGPPAIAYAASTGKYLLCNPHYTSPTTPNEIRGRLITTSGAITAYSQFVINNNSFYEQAGSELRLAAASNGNNFLVVWAGQSSSISGGINIYCRRISGSDGSLLDANVIPVVVLDDEQSDLAVASNGTDFLIVWYQGPSEYPDGNSDIFGARISNSLGRTLDYIPVSTVSCIIPIQQSPAVGSDGSSFLIVWSDNRNSATWYDIYGTRVSSSGQVLDPGGIAISTASFNQSAPDVTWNGADYLVAWTDNRNGSSSDIYGARVNNGVVQGSAILISLASPGVPASGVQKNPRLTSNLNDFFVVWEDYRNSSTIPDVYGARVNSGGSVYAADMNGIPISTRTTYERSPDVAYNGTDYVVVWEDNRNVSNQLDIYGARVSTSGSVLDANGFAITTVTGSQGGPVIARASGGSDCLVVWTGAPGGVHGAFVTSGTSVGSTITVNNSTTVSGSVAIGALSAGYLVVWYNYVVGGNNGDVYGSRVTTSGSVLDPTGSELKITDVPLNQSPNPNSVAANGTSYLVAHYGFNTLKTRANFVTP